MKIAAITPHVKHDYLAAAVIEGLRDLRHEIIASDKFLWLNPVPDGEFIEHAQEADYIFAFWSKRRTPSPKYHLLDKIDRWNKTVFIDGSEYNQAGRPKEDAPWLNKKMLERCLGYFKRECTVKDLSHDVKPLLFAARAEDFASHVTEERDIDIHCVFGQSNTGLREDILRRLKNLNKNSSLNIVDRPLGRPKFLRQLTGAKIGIDAWGGGQCCQRLFEIAANAAIPCYQKYTIAFPYKFADGVDAIEFETAEEMEDKILALLADPDKIETMRKALYRNLMSNHTCLARVYQLFSSLDE